MENLVYLYMTGLIHSVPQKFSNPEEKRKVATNRQKIIHKLVKSLNLVELIKFPEWNMSRVARKKGLPFLSLTRSGKQNKQLLYQYTNHLSRLLNSLDDMVWKNISSSGNPKTYKRTKKVSYRRKKIFSIKRLEKPKALRVGMTIRTKKGVFVTGRWATPVKINNGVKLGLLKVSRAICKIVNHPAHKRTEIDTDTIFLNRNGIAGVVFFKNIFVEIKALPECTKMIVREIPAFCTQIYNNEKKVFFLKRGA